MKKVLLVDEFNVTGDLSDPSRESQTLVFQASGELGALEALEQHKPDLVLLALPDDGEALRLTLLRAIHSRLPGLPIIIVTSGQLAAQMLEPLCNRAASFALDLNGDRSLPAMLERVLNLPRSACHGKRLIGYLCNGESSFCLENDPALIAPLVEHLQEAASWTAGLDEMERMQVGIALQEAFLNAIYHGNLEVSSDLRETGESAFLQRADERRKISPYRERRVHVWSKVSEDAVTYRIRDEGKGFDVTMLPDPTAPDNLEKASGRGVLLMRTLVDITEYNAAGNELTLIKKIPPAQERV
jgi:anti-sigma regulatory factor (Ser/Thr protein kinase)